MLAKGANPNLQDMNGNTVLHLLVLHDKMVSHYDVANRRHDLTMFTAVASVQHGVRVGCHPEHPQQAGPDSADIGGQIGSQ